MTTVSGTVALGGLYRPITADEAHAALRVAWDLGVRSFDTAPHDRWTELDGLVPGQDRLP